jgi:thiol-disulfide isomerase/thioredoxin
MKAWMISCCLALCTIAGKAQSQQVQRMKIEDVVKMIDTTSVPLIVNFWATWCQPCIHEIPWFEKTVKEYADKKVKLVLVSLDGPESYPAKLGAFVKQQGYTSTIAWLDETNADKFCPPISDTWNGVIPVTLMVNKAKKYREFFGYQLREERFKLEVEKLVAP